MSLATYGQQSALKQYQGPGIRRNLMQGQQADTQQRLAMRSGLLDEAKWQQQKKWYAERAAGAKKGAKGLSALIGSYNKAYGRARTANEQRYQEMLGIMDQTTGQRATDIRSEGMGEQANIMQRLARSGMGGSTVGATLRAGVRRGTQSNLNRLADTMQGRRLGIMERRTDEYPQAGMITALASLLGQSGGGNAGNLAGALGKMRMG